MTKKVAMQMVATEQAGFERGLRAARMEIDSLKAQMEGRKSQQQLEAERVRVQAIDAISHAIIACARLVAPH